MRRNQSGPNIAQEKAKFLPKRSGSTETSIVSAPGPLQLPVPTPSKGTAHTEALWARCSHAGNDSNYIKDGPYEKNFCTVF